MRALLDLSPLGWAASVAASFLLYTLSRFPPCLLQEYTLFSQVGTDSHFLQQASDVYANYTHHHKVHTLKRGTWARRVGSSRSFSVPGLGPQIHTLCTTRGVCDAR